MKSLFNMLVPNFAAIIFLAANTNAINKKICFLLLLIGSLVLDIEFIVCKKIVFWAALVI